MAPAVNHKKGKSLKAVKVGSRRGTKRNALSSVGGESNKVRKQTNSDVSRQPGKPDLFVAVDDDAFMTNARVSKDNKASTTTMKTRRVVKPLKPHGASSSDDDASSDD